MSLVSLACLLGLGGCAAVEVTHADGERDVSLYPFTIAMIHRPTDRPLLVKRSTLGVSITEGGFNLGFQNEDVALVPAGCHAVFVIRSEAQAAAARELGKNIEKKCVIAREGA